MAGDDGRALAADVAAFGGEPPELSFEVWPENWPAVELFMAAATQWRHGGKGPTGLDYTAVEALMRLRRVAKRDRADLLADVQIMERASLAVWAERREQLTHGTPP